MNMYINQNKNKTCKNNDVRMLSHNLQNTINLINEKMINTFG